MKFAYLVMFEPRALHSTIQGLYDNVINRYDADIFICMQKTFSDDEERLKLFNKNVVYTELYDKPNPFEYFGTNNNLDVTTNEQNWKTYSNLQIYINYHKMAKAIFNSIDNYDYFIILRTDTTILFPFPDKELFEKIPEAMYFIDAEYGKNWGDRGIPTFIHRNYILSLLNSYHNVISNIENRQNLIDIINQFRILEKGGGLNQERFQNICIYFCNLKENIKLIKALNYFFTACKHDHQHTTWSIPKIHEKYNVICKYELQCNEAYENYNLWLTNPKWCFYNNSICINCHNQKISFE
jgi:hypothetical protein